MLFFLYKNSTYKKQRRSLSLELATHIPDAFGPNSKTIIKGTHVQKIQEPSLLSEKTYLPLSKKNQQGISDLQLSCKIASVFNHKSLRATCLRTKYSQMYLTFPHTNAEYKNLNSSSLVTFLSKSTKQLSKSNYFLKTLSKKLNTSFVQTHLWKSNTSYVLTESGSSYKIYPQNFTPNTALTFEVSTYSAGVRRNNSLVRQSLLNYYGYLSKLKIFPSVFFVNHMKFLNFQRKIQSHTKNSKLIQRYYGRHSSSTLHLRFAIFRSSIGGEFFTNWNVRTFTKSNFKEILKLLWRFFKLKLERFFFKILGVRTHIWFLSVWEIFLSGIACKNSWDYFEAKKMVEYTRRGHRYVIEYAEDAKFFIRIIVVMFTFVGGIKIFLDRISDWMSQFRNHWAYVRYIAETVRKCSNFFWFRFFMNYRISIQGKIGGQLRAQKKIYNRGTISIEDWSAMVGHHKAFSNTKFGIFNLSMWLQFKVPNVVETFGGHELITTMRILLSRYSIPWLAERLAHVITSIDHDEKVKKSFSKRGGEAQVGTVKRTKSKYPLSPIQYRIAVRASVKNKLGVAKRY